jgi:hypothetical protein
MGELGSNIAAMGAGTGLVALLAPQLVQNLGSALAPEAAITDAYKLMEQCQAAGQPVPAALYAQFIAAASPKAQELGQENRLVQAMAERYAQSQTQAGAIIAEIGSGAFDTAAAKLQTKLDAQAQAALEARSKAVQTQAMTSNPSTSIAAGSINAQRVASAPVLAQGGA